MNKKRLVGTLSVLIAVAVMLAVAAPVFAGPAGKININTASAKELTKLNKVGEKYAARIVDYRQKKGQFKKPEDIMKVKGIGKTIFEVNKDVIVVK